jgi:hypothetical protein
MMRLLELLIFGHVHKWKEDKRFALTGPNWNGERATIGEKVHCTCEICGKPKAFKLT